MFFQSGCLFLLGIGQFTFGAIRVSAGSWLRGQFSDFMAIEVDWGWADYQLFNSSNLEHFRRKNRLGDLPLWFDLL